MSSKLHLGDLPFDEDYSHDLIEDEQYQRQKIKTTKTKKRKSETGDYQAQRAQKRQSIEFHDYR